MKKFDRELEQLRQDVITMGKMALQMVSSAISVLDDGDTSVCKAIYASEQRLDQWQLDIDHEAVRLLTVYSPVATDLRFILCVTRMTTELERIGDQAVNMCEYLELLATDAPEMPILRKMAELGVDMLHDALDAFERKDVEKAMVVIRSDNRVDALKEQILQEILRTQNHALASRSISVDLAILLLSRSLERIADQACNMCEEIVYLTRGRDIRHSGEKTYSDIPEASQE